MEKQMEQCKVYIDDEKKLIYIEQERFQDDNSIIYLHPEQISILIEWLKEAQGEFKNV